MTSYEHSPEGRYNITISTPGTDAMVAAGNMLVGAQALVTACPTVPELTLDEIIQVNYMHWVHSGASDINTESNLTDRELAAQSNLVAATVAHHFGLEASAEVHTERLKGTSLAAATQRGQERDEALNKVVLEATLPDSPPETIARSRVLAEEIDNPAISWMTFDHLYTVGDRESFDPLMDRLEKLIQELLASKSVTFLLSALPTALEHLQTFGGRVISIEYDHMEQVGSLDLMRSRHNRVLGLYKAVNAVHQVITQTELDNRPPEQVRRFVRSLAPDDVVRGSLSNTWKLKD